MNKLTDHIKSITFRTKWIFMSPQVRYAYLWSRTKKVGNLDFSILTTLTK